MARLFTPEASITGHQPVGPEVRADAGSPHAAGIGAGTAPAGGQYQQPQGWPAGSVNASFLQKAQMKGAAGPAVQQPGKPPAAAPPAQTSSPAQTVPPSTGAGVAPATGSPYGGGTSGWKWTAKVVRGVGPSPSYGGAAYNGGGGPLANGMSNPGAPRAGIGGPKVIQGQAEPPSEP